MVAVGSGHGCHAVLHAPAGAGAPTAVSVRSMIRSCLDLTIAPTGPRRYSRRYPVSNAGVGISPSRYRAALMHGPQIGIEGDSRTAARVLLDVVRKRTASRAPRPNSEVVIPAAAYCGGATIVLWRAATCQSAS